MSSVDNPCSHVKPRVASTKYTMCTMCMYVCVCKYTYPQAQWGLFAQLVYILDHIGGREAIWEVGSMPSAPPRAGLCSPPHQGCPEWTRARAHIDNFSTF
eukprot:3771355-Karenia_brevis.AAC.1